MSLICIYWCCTFLHLRSTSSFLLVGWSLRELPLSPPSILPSSFLQAQRCCWRQGLGGCKGMGFLEGNPVPLTYPRRDIDCMPKCGVCWQTWVLRTQGTWTKCFLTDTNTVLNLNFKDDHWSWWKLARSCTFLPKYKEEWWEDQNLRGQTQLAG